MAAFTGVGQTTRLILGVAFATLGLALVLLIGAMALASTTARANPQISYEAMQAFMQHFSCNVQPTIAGTPGNDTLQGTAGADVIKGYGGVDALIGKGSNDKLCGDEGADTASGQAGNDVLRGGPGNDHAFSGNEGNDWVFGDSGNDILGAHPGKDGIYGGADNDTLYGDTWPSNDTDPTDEDYLDGGPGVDTCYPGLEDTVKNCENVIWPDGPPA
jgi:Ca2+-binding RTX toxin-like protein